MKRSKEVTILENEFRKISVQVVGDMISIIDTAGLDGHVHVTSMTKPDFTALEKIVSDLYSKINT